VNCHERATPDGSRVAGEPRVDKEKQLFNLTINHMVIEVYRTAFAEDGTPIRVTVTVSPADRNQIVYDIGDVPQYPEEAAKPQRPSSTGVAS